MFIMLVKYFGGKAIATDLHSSRIEKLWALQRRRRLMLAIAI